MKRLLFAIVSLLLLNNCSGRINTVAVGGDLDWTYNVEWSYSFWCGIALGESGLMPPPPPNNTIQVGFADIYQPGSGPFACNYNQQTFIRGRANFDISRFNNIATAILNFSIFQSTDDSWATNQVPPICIANYFGEPTSDGDDWWDIANPQPLPPPNFPCAVPILLPQGGSNYSIDVTSMVNSSLSAGSPSIQFILAGPVLGFPSSLPNDNNSEISAYGGEILQITYNTSLNPRAPQ